MCQNWRLIELTNGNIGAVPVGSLLPIGAITRKVAQEPRCTPTFPNTESITSNTQELSLPEQLEF